jgi:membrane-bound lytic murein transglycosylase B
LLVYDNFRTIMRWNKSTYFAAAVGYLADRMVGQEHIEHG